jgi:hypothetical protein
MEVPAETVAFFRAREIPICDASFYEFWEMFVD